MKNEKNWAIDLGTTNSSIAWSNNNISQVVELSNGMASLPSMVVVNGGKPTVVLERKRSVFAYTRGEGELFEEWKISGMSDEKFDRPVIGKKGTKMDGLSPKNLSALIVAELIKQAEKKTGETIKKLSVSIPANFNEEKRRNTLTAIKIAAPSIKNIKLVHEPTAAAAALLTEYRIENILNKNILVYDMGGGTTDISIVRFSDVAGSISIDVQETNGIDFAGKEIDRTIYEKFLVYSIAKTVKETPKNVRDYFKKEENNFDLNSILFEAEKIKIELSKEMDDCESSFKIFYKGSEYKVVSEISYQEFVKELSGNLNNVNNKIVEALRKSKLSKEDIFIVVPAGSSTRGPWILDSINNFFGKKIVEEIVKPETAIAIGGSILSGINHNDGLFEYKENDLEISELVPNFIGIAVSGETSSWMINKNAQIPISIKKTFYINNNSSEIPVEIIESSDKKIPSIQANILKILQINQFADNSKPLSEEVPIDLEMVYDNKMSLSLFLHYNGKIVEIEDVKPKKDQLNNLEKIKKSIAHVRSTFFNDIKSEGDLNNLYGEAINFFEYCGLDTSWYLENKPTLIDKKELCFSMIMKMKVMDMI